MEEVFGSSEKLTVTVFSGGFFWLSENVFFGYNRLMQGFLFQLIVGYFSHMSLKRSHQWAGFVGRMVWRWSEKQRRIASTNIKLCYPELSTQEQEQLAQAALIETVKTFFELGRVWKKHAKNIDGLIVNVHGKDVLDVDEDAMLADLKAEALRSFHLSIGIEYYTKENMPHFVGQAARDSLGLGVGIAYPAAETIKQLVSKANAQGSGVAMTLPEELRPAGLAVAAAPVAAATTESAEANEGKKEEEAAPADAAAGLGDLF